MSARCTAWLMNQRHADSLSPTEWAVLRFVAERFDEDNAMASLSIRSTREDTHYCDKTVRRAFNELVEAGWIERDRSPGHTNTYFIPRYREPVPGDGPDYHVDCHPAARRDRA